MKKCIYKHELPVSGDWCWAYWSSDRPDGRLWCHWPICSKENCPIKHPELLEGAKLSESEDMKRKKN